MDQPVPEPLVTRGRILLLALLAAFVWLLLSIFTGGTAAVADDRADSESSEGLIGSLIATVDEVVPVATQTVNEVTEPLGLEPVLEGPLFQQPAFQQPAIADTVNLVDELVKKSTAALIGVSLSDPLNFDPVSSAEGLPWAAAAYVPGPAAVKAIAVTPDTRATSVPAAGSLSSPNAPPAPTPVLPAPAPAPAPALGQSSGSPALVASLEGFGGPLTLAVASAASAHFALPASPAFDHDTSPD